MFVDQDPGSQVEGFLDELCAFQCSILHGCFTSIDIFDDPTLQRQAIAGRSKKVDRISATLMGFA